MTAKPMSPMSDLRNKLYVMSAVEKRVWWQMDYSTRRTCYRHMPVVYFTIFNNYNRRGVVLTCHSWFRVGRACRQQDGRWVNGGGQAVGPVGAMPITAIKTTSAKRIKVSPGISVFTTAKVDPPANWFVVSGVKDGKTTLPRVWPQRELRSALYGWCLFLCLRQFLPLYFRVRFRLDSTTT